MITGINVARVPRDLPLRFRCGYMRGAASEVSPSSGLRFICYCKDCQAFAHFLERDGSPVPGLGLFGRLWIG